MSGFEARLPCPVCLGTRMEKVRFGHTELTLDHCSRCAGTWFDEGEVQRLRALPRSALAGRIVSRARAPALCHACHAPVDRDAERCAGCGWTLTLDCPVCARAMRTAERDGVRLDVCTGCRGVWFDRRELAAVWTAALAAAGSWRGVGGDAGVGGGPELAEVVLHTPELVVHGVRAGVEVAGAAGRGLANAPDALLAAAEVGADVASSVFSVLLEILGGLLEGIG